MKTQSLAKRVAQRLGQMEGQFGPTGGAVKPGKFQVASIQWDHREADPNNNEYPRKYLKRENALIEKYRELLPHEESNGLDDGYYAVFSSEPLDYEEAEELLKLNYDNTDGNGIHHFESKKAALAQAKADWDTAD